MTAEFIQIAGPAVTLFGVFAGPFVVKLSNRASSKSDRWEDYRNSEEFLEKLTPETHPLVIQKWYEAMSGGDRAGVDEIRFMVDPRFSSETLSSSEVLSLRKRTKDLVGFVKPGADDAVGHQYKGPMKYWWYRWAYNLWNLGGYFIGFGVPTIPAIRSQWDFLERDGHPVVLYCLLCVMGFGYGTSRIRAMLNVKIAKRLIARSREISSLEDGFALVSIEERAEPAPALTESTQEPVPVPPPTEVAPLHLDAAE